MCGLNTISKKVSALFVNCEFKNHSKLWAERDKEVRNSIRTFFRTLPNKKAEKHVKYALGFIRKSSHFNTYRTQTFGQILALYEKRHIFQVEMLVKFEQDSTSDNPREFDFYLKYIRISWTFLRVATPLMEWRNECDWNTGKEEELTESQKEADFPDELKKVKITTNVINFKMSALILVLSHIFFVENTSS